MLNYCNTTPSVLKYMKLTFFYSNFDHQYVVNKLVS
jgi:hypothetical protein